MRSSYSVGYDYMAGEYHNINAGAPPFGNRTLRTDVSLDDPWANEPGGDPHPIFAETNAPFINYGAYGTDVPPELSSTQV